MKKMKTWLAVVALFLSPAAFAQTLSAFEIMQKNAQQVQSEDESVEVTMTLIDNKGRERVRQVRQVTKTDPADNRSVVIQFLSPADVKGTGFLAIEYTGREDDQWLYLPALKKTRRISASDQTDNFVGSDFTYEDLSTEDLKDYHYKIMGTEKPNGSDCYVIEAIPGHETKQKESGYSKRHLYIRKDNFMIVQVKYYDHQNEQIKLLKVTNMGLVKDTGKWRTFNARMENLRTGHATTLTFKNHIINKGLSRDQFTTRYIEKGI
jgi:outer membrane lipoprotein-sorting protein